ncbi:hypothetical protein [Roseitranquillus sediminis]|uniref:hypothetical protein n=1 Tax=Roseitranquillus sediminis TaxID=2809051 RepID=UPI001D0C3A4F|nr:hypothetical protein [Roseitranquillus sediminis]MBM9593044.1 hypothetical protein [Roseitranquillus sediminis]
MPLDKFVLILVLVIVGAGITVWLGALLTASAYAPGIAAGSAMVILPLAYVVVRIAADRVRNREDQRYDRIEK